MPIDYTTIRYLETLGNGLGIHYTDGKTLLAHPDGRGRYLPVKTAAPPPDPDPDPDPPPPSGDWSHPAPGASLTSPYGPREFDFHYGIDVSSTTAPVGVPVLAVTNMVITAAVDAYEGGNETAGTYVKGNDGEYTFAYYHGADGSLAVSAGQTVTKGTTLFMEGATGNVTGTHLHFELYEGVHQDPWPGFPSNPPDPQPILAAHGVTIT